MKIFFGSRNGPEQDADPNTAKAVSDGLIVRQRSNPHQFVAEALGSAERRLMATKDQHAATLLRHSDDAGDAIVRDSNGNVIPLSQRFNLASDDIRFAAPEGSDFDAKVTHILSKFDATIQLPRFFRRIFAKPVPPEYTMDPRGASPHDFLVGARSVAGDMRTAFDAEVVRRTGLPRDVMPDLVTPPDIMNRMLYSEGVGDADRKAILDFAAERFPLFDRIHKAAELVESFFRGEEWGYELADLMMADLASRDQSAPADQATLFEVAALDSVLREMRRTQKQPEPTDSSDLDADGAEVAHGQRFNPETDLPAGLD